MTTITIQDVLRDRGSDALYTVPASGTVAQAVEVMAAHEVGAVLAMTEDELVAGIFSERDLMVRVVRPGRDPRATPLSLVMTRDVLFVSPGTTLEAALALMYVRGFRHLLVIDGPKVHGLVSMRDLAYQLIRHGEGRLEAAVRAKSEGARP
jgi:CBS domain-containing protein